MSYVITTRTATSVRTYTAIGDLAALIEAAFDDGALGLTVMVRK